MKSQALAIQSQGGAAIAVVQAINEMKVISVQSLTLLRFFILAISAARLIC